MRYGYARISSTSSNYTSTEQLRDQSVELERAGAEVIFSEHFTGMKADRPEFNDLLSTIDEGDTLIVTRLDRIARSARDGMGIVADLLSRGVSVHVLNMGLMDNSTTGKLITTIFFAFAEFERDNIVNSFKEGKDRARERGVRVDGRPYLELVGFDGLLKRQKAGEITVREAIAELGCSKATWYKRARAA